MESEALTSESSTQRLLSAGRGVLMLLSVLGAGGTSYGWLGAHREAENVTQGMVSTTMNSAQVYATQATEIARLQAEIDTIRGTCREIVENERQNTAAWREQCR